MTDSEILTAYRRLLDLKDEAAAVVSGLNKQIAEIERAIMDRFAESGLSQMKGGGVTVSLKEKWRAKYLPEHWDAIVKWAAETGNTHLIQRRLSDKPVMELLDAGVSLPEGLTVEMYKDLAFLRTA